MEPISTLKGCLVSRFLHGIKIILLTSSSVLFISNSTIAHNKPNKAPPSDDGAGTLRGLLELKESQHKAPYYSPGPMAFENGIHKNTIQYTQTQKASAQKENFYQLPTSHSVYGPSAITYLHTGAPITGEDLERAYLKLLSYNILDSVSKITGATSADIKLFCNYYRDKMHVADRDAFWKEVENRTIVTNADIRNYALQKINDYVKLFYAFKEILKNYPSAVAEYSSRQQQPSTEGTCNPPCDNIGFENGTLSAWSAYYAENYSGNTGFSTSALTGGPCGAVTSSAFDPNTNTNQVTIMTGPGLDPVAGALIPVVCPTGGSFSCRIGDGTRNGAQVGVLEQSFTVTAANANFTYMYAVVLENPYHPYYEQPYFNVQILDQNGNPIANCGNYSVVSGPGLPGYTSIYYAPDGDTVYCKPWTTVFVPLQAYIGQCMTLKVTASDCALGGHFGYAYFDATCSPGIISSSPAICGHNVTLSAPGGAASYQWTGPCIVGSSTQQTVTVSCAGIYKVAITSISGSGCADTIVDTVSSSTPPVVSVISHTNVSCNGGNNGSAVASATLGIAPYTYTWMPGGQTGANATNLSAGTYTVTVTDINGCTDTTTVAITQPPLLTLTAGPVTNVSCNGSSNGSASVTASGGTAPYKYVWTPNVSSTNSASNLSAGVYSVTVTDANSCSTSTTLTVTQPTALSVVSSSVPVTCNGGNNGSVTVSASGGTPSYQYTWSPNVSTTGTTNNLTAGIYTVTVTDGHGCSLTVPVTVTQPTPILVTIASHHNVTCKGDNNGSAVASASGGTPSYNFVWSNGQKGVSSTSLTAGTYTCTVTDANGCTGNASIVIGEPPQLVITTIVSNVHCNGGSDGTAIASTTGGTSPYTYSWNTSPAQTTPTANNLIAGTYIVTATDSNGCNIKDTITITQPPVLSATMGPVTNVSCNGGSNGSAVVNVTGGTSPYKYSWSPSGGNGSVASNLTAGAYIVTITDANSCTATASATIIQPLLLTTNLVSVTNVSCYGGNNGSATINATGGTAPYKYAWSPNISSTYFANNIKAGTYTVTVTDANNCSSNITVIVTQPTALTSALVSVTDVSCYNGNNGSIVTSATGGTPPYSFTWSPSVSNSGLSATNLGAGSYTITVTDANGCSTAMQSIVRQPLPINIISSTIMPKCNGQQNGSATIAVSGGTPTYSYIWNTAPAQFSFTADNLGAGIYVVTVTDTHGCIKTDTVTVKQPPVLTGTIIAVKNDLCYGDSNGSATVYTTGGTMPYSFIWNTAPPQTGYTASGLKAGTYLINVTDANGCPSNNTVTITQPAPVVTQATGPDSICSGTTVTIMATANGGNGTYSYQWSTGTGSIATQNVTPDSSTTYTVTATDGNGCKGTPATVTINTWNFGPANLSVTLPQSICKGDTVTLYANVTNSNSGSVNIQWNNGYNGPGPFKLVLPDDTNFIVTVINQCGSVVTKNIPVTVNPLPVIHIPLQTGASCRTVSFTYNDTASENEEDDYEWDFGDGSTGNTNPVSHTYTQSGLYTVTVVLTTPEGCKSTANEPANVTIYPTAKAIFTANPTSASILNPVISYTDASINTSTWVWDFGDGQSASYTTHQNPVHRYADTGTYYIHLYTNNNFGCADTANDVVHIEPAFTFYVPNAFTPNGDNENDYFNGKGIGIIQYHMTIFDRWGMMLFESTSLNEGWDGRANDGSQVAQEDTYVYKIDLTDIFKKKHSYIGSVTLIK